jgi:hypothetical protein
MEQWRETANAPLKSFQLERLAVEFLQIWPYGQHGVFWYDWMVRDFFGHPISRAGSHLVMPRTGEVVRLGNEWLIRAQRAHHHAINACEYERENYQTLAGQEWQAIFGGTAPVVVE